MSLFFSPIVGLEISDRLVSLLELKQNGHKLMIVKKSQLSLPSGLVVQGKLIDEAKLLELMKNFLIDSGMKINQHTKVFFSLAENQVYTYMSHVAFQKSKDYSRIMKKELSSNLPIESQDRETIYFIEKEDKSTAEVLTFSASRKVLEQWGKFLKDLHIVQYHICPTALAIYMVLQINKEKTPVAVIVPSEFEVQVYFFAKEGLKYSFIINLNDAGLTAEMKKEKIVEKIKKAIDFFANFKKIEINRGILLSENNDDQMQYLGDKLGFNIELANNPFGNDVLPVSYLLSAGLVMIGLKIADLKQVPFFSIIEKNKNERKENGDIDRSTSDDEEFDESAFRRQKINLIIVLLVGVIVVGLSFWYQGAQKKEKAAEMLALQANFDKTEVFEMAVPIAVDASEYTTDRVIGRIIQDKVQSIGEVAEMTNVSLIAMQKETDKLESIWSIPIKIDISTTTTELTLNSGNLARDYTVSWLVYQERQANKMIEDRLNKVFQKDNIEYGLNNIEKQSIESTDNPNVYNLNVKVTISVNNVVDKLILETFK